ncbi:MAG: DUF1573 domain-containing protein [Elusimicrobiota bacterium]
MSINKKSKSKVVMWLCGYVVKWLVNFRWLSGYVVRWLVSTNHLFTYSLIHLLFITYSLIHCLYSQTIQVDKKVIDFGTVKEKTVLNYTIEVKNISKNLLRVGIRPACDCISVSPDRVNLKQNQKAKIKVKIDTKGYKGDFNEKVFFQSNDPKNPYISIDINGYVSSARKITIPITVFDSAGCLFCIELRKNILPNLEKKYGIKIELDEYSVDEPKNYAALVLLEKKSQKILNKIPVVFIGKDIIGGKEEIKKLLPKLLEKYTKQGYAEKIDITTGEVQKAEIVKKLKLLPVISAGIIDSVNPCAFATIVFLITYLSMVLKKNRYTILLIGISFSVGVFVTYFLIGLGLFRFIQKINQIVIISKTMYFLLGISVFFLAYFHFRDALLIKKGTGLGEKTIKLKLPDKIRWRIYDIITKLTVLKYLIPVAFLIGAIITVLELFCTGQIYLPTIMYLAKLHISGIFYLLLYCFLFVIPLVIIFSLFYFGLSMDWLEAFFRKKIFLIKICISCFFVIIGILIFIITFFA